MAFEPIARAWDDPALTKNRLLVYAGLALYSNKHGENAWPSVATLAEGTGLGRSTVQRTLRELEEAGYIEAIHDPTKATQRRYRLVLARLRGPGAGRGPRAGHAPERGPGGPGAGPNPSIDPSKSVIPAQGELVAKPDPLAGFDAWWKHYPRKVAKKAAQRAWKALKPNTELQAIILADTVGRDWSDDPRYVMHPATYLNGARWEDEKPPSAAGVSRGTKAHQRESAGDRVRRKGQEWLEEQRAEREGRSAAGPGGDRKIIEGVFTRPDD